MKSVLIRSVKMSIFCQLWNSGQNKNHAARLDCCDLIQTIKLKIETLHFYKKWMREGGLQWFILPKILENHAEFGPRNFFLIPFYEEIRWKWSGTLYFCVSDVLIPDSIFLYKYKSDCLQKSTLVVIYRNEAHLDFFFIASSGKNPVATTWHHFFFGIQIPWCQERVFQYKEWMRGVFKDQLCRKSKKKKTCQIWISELLSSHSHIIPVRAEWQNFTFGLRYVDFKLELS